MNLNIMMGKNKILEDIHPLDIIREVQKWPALYDKNSPERGNTHFKTKLWSEVAKALFPEWTSFTKSEKDRRIAGLTKRWRNLRDTFKREVEVQKRIKEGYDIKKKMYVFYKQMLFLLPHLRAESDADDADDAGTAGAASAASAGAASPRPAASPQPPPAPAPAPAIARKRPRPACLDEIDEDKHFLLSLIPSLKRMNDDEKLTAKMDILKVIKNVRRQRSRSSPAPSFSYQEDNLADGLKVETLSEVEACFLDTEEGANSDGDSE